MAGLFTDAEEERIAKAVVNYAGGGTDLVLHLFMNNYTPVDGSILANFTEATFSGYAAITLTGSSWVITAGAPTLAAYALQNFLSDADQTVQYLYGYYLTRGTDLVAGERFTDGPYAILGLTDYLTVTPKLYFKKAGE